MGRKRVKKSPMVSPLTLSAVTDDHALYQYFAAEPNRTRHQVRELHALFAFKSVEREFAMELLLQKRNYWVFRCNQQRFCGDFIVVDMSCPILEKRKVFVIDLKENAALKVGGGGAGIQFKNAKRAVSRIACGTGALLPDAPFEKLVGDKDRLLAYLGLVET